MEIIAAIIAGTYSEWVFNVLMVNLALALKNNLALLLMFAMYWQKISKVTKNPWDDKASNWLVRVLTGFKNKNKKKTL